MAINLPELPYAKDALAPYISANTLEFHQGKHHKTYVDNLNKLIAGTDLEAKSVEEIIKLPPRIRLKQVFLTTPHKAGIILSTGNASNRREEAHLQEPLLPKLMLLSAATTNLSRNSRMPEPLSLAAAGLGWWWTAAI